MSTTVETVRNANQFVDWLETHEAGARCEYHRGLLAIDRVPRAAYRELNLLADTVLIRAAKGHVRLLQRRLDADSYVYIAEATGR